jgi:hypothetical protein
MKVEKFPVRDQVSVLVQVIGLKAPFVTAVCVKRSKVLLRKKRPERQAAPWFTGNAQDFSGGAASSAARQFLPMPEAG